MICYVLCVRQQITIKFAVHVEIKDVYVVGIQRLIIILRMVAVAIIKGNVNLYVINAKHVEVEIMMMKKINAMLFVINMMKCIAITPVYQPVSN